MSNAVVARFDLPHLFVRGQDTTIRCPLYLDEDLVTATAGTAAVYDGDGNLVATLTGTVVSDVLEATLLGSTTASLTLGERWRAIWTVTTAGGSIVSRNGGMLIRSELRPVVTDGDLYRRVSTLDPSVPGVIHTRPGFGNQRQDAWEQINRKLLSRGRRPWLVMEPDALREVHTTLTLALIFEDFSHKLNESYAETAAMYRAQFADAWGELAFEYDADQDGVADATGRKSAQSTIWLQAL